jgi:DNA polymerase-4
VIDSAKMLLNNVDLEEKKIRLLGVGFSNFGEVKVRERYDGHQQTLFPND